MAYRIFVRGGQFYIEDTITEILYEAHAAHVMVERAKDSSDSFYFHNVIGWKTSNKINIADMQNEDGVAYTLISFTEFYENNTGQATTKVSNLIQDAFGRLRISDTGQRFDCEFIYNLQPTLFDTFTNGGGTVSHNTSSRDVSLKTNSITSGDYAALVQHWHNPYTAGNSQLIDITGALNAGNISGASVELFIKNGIDNSETIYEQDDWNINTVPDVDWSKSQIFQMDFQSLKVGRIKFNLVRKGNGVAIHEIYNDNIRTGGYWQYPALPLRYYCYNTATETITEIGYFDDDNGIGYRCRVPINANAELRAICCTVKSEGGPDLSEIPGFGRAIDRGATAKVVSSTLIPVISIRVRSLFNSLDNRGIYIPLGYEFQTDNPIRYAVILGADLTGASWVNVDTNNSGIEYDLSATALTGGVTINSGYLASGGKNTDSSGAGLLGKTLLSKGYGTGTDILTVAAIRTTTTNANVLASINWKEIR